MAIDFGSEQVIPLSDAADVIPRRRQGRKTAVSTLHRWATTGVRGVKLEVLQVGGTRCTSVPALQRFFDRLAGEHASEASMTRVVRPDVEAALDREGL
jgi:hypothetical protein